MAKIQDKHLKLRYNQRAYFGDSDDSSIFHDGAMLRISSTVSGVDPTQDYHLATKQYVDSATAALDWQDSVLTVSGSPPGGPSSGDRYLITASGASGAWSAHEDDITEWDGAEWDFSSPNEGFATFVEDENTIYVYSNGIWVKMDSVFDHGGLAGLSDDDHTQYSLADGTRAFTGTVGGITPVSSADLTTKGYVDDAITTATGSLTDDHGSLNGLTDDDHTMYTRADGLRPFTSTVSGITPTEDAHLTTKAYVDDAIATATGTLTTDHGELTGLLDDDHTQYVPTDGSRGFTSTVSGVTPVQDNDLVTKDYVDSKTDDLTETGRTALVLDEDRKCVPFSSNFSDTNYVLSVILRNTVDQEPAVYPMLVIDTTTSGFCVLFSGDIDSNNYYLDWMARHDE